jgi:alanine racemase
MYRKTYIEISADNLVHNVKTLISKYPNYKYYIGVAKGNVYGHGSQSVKYLVEAGINYLAVSSLEEAMLIRKEGVAIPILLLQPIHTEDIHEAIKNNITITLSNYEYFKKLIELPLEQELKIHLKINSGFNRLGVSKKEQVKEIFETLKKSKHFVLEGIYSHFATSGRYDKHWDNQLRAFTQITSQIDLKEIPIVHLDRSLTLTSHEKIDFCTGARIGVAMYGYNQSTKKQNKLKSITRSLIKFDFDKKLFDYPEVLKSSFSFFSEVIEINKVKKGDFVGYGATFVVQNDGFVACVPIGYADGFFRKNKNSFVSINGKRYQIISVDMGIMTILVDQTVAVYDKVELIGENISAKEVATHNDTTIYEILCAIKESVPRIIK